MMLAYEGSQAAADGVGAPSYLMTEVSDYFVTEDGHNIILES